MSPVTSWTNFTTPKSVAFATNAATLTAAQAVTGVITTSGITGNATLTLPSAADLVAAVPGAQVGTVVALDVMNTVAYTISFGTAATGGTIILSLAQLIHTEQPTNPDRLQYGRQRDPPIKD